MTDMDRLFRLLEEKGGARYGGEQVNQLEHALQCALLAERSQSSDSLIIAALLHDIGHLTSDDEGLAARGRDARHEDVGAAELGRTFGPEVTEPVRLHVEAKRYLCATNERYRGHLSPASITSLRVQGGVFSEQEAEQFARHAFAKPAIALRSWDDNAKCPDTQTPSLDHFRAIAEPLSRGWRAGRLVLVVGPSGAGKDTLIAAAQERLAGDPRYVFPKRVVTRPCNREREAHESATETQFEERLANGGFCLAWQAHGLSYGLPLSDLVQEGSVGLMEAAARFEPEREIRFSTYASWWIRSSMQDFILRNWSIVRTGTTAAHKTLFFNFRRLRAQIANEHANEHAGDHTRPHDGPIGPAARTEVARRLRVRPKDVEVMEARLSGTDRSLNAHVGEDGEAQWQDFLTCEAPLPDEVVMTRHDGQLRARLIAEAMETLDERESTIIRERRLSDDTVTLAALGHRLGISKERVRQIESQALAKLRSALVARVGDPATAGLTPTV